jgi:RND family efflux transporter MFP subunit
MKNKLKSFLSKISPRKRHFIFIIGNLLFVLTLCAIFGYVITNMLFAEEEYIDKAELVSHTVEKRELIGEISSTGNVTLSSESTHSFNQDGTIEKIYFKVDDNVKKGDILAKLSSTEIDKELSVLNKSLTEVNKKISTLYKESKPEQDTIKKLENSVYVAETNYNSSVAKRTYIDTKSDIAGKVYKINVNLNNNIISGNTNSQITDMEYTQAHIVVVDEASYDELLLDPAFVPTIQYNIYSQLSGTINNISVSVGSSVVSGTKLFSIDGKEVEIEIRQNENALIDAKKELNDYKKGLVVSDELSALNSEKNDLLTKIEDINKKKSDTEIKANMDGKILNIDYSEGDKISANTTLITIENIEFLSVKIKVNNSEASILKPGMNTSILIDESAVQREYTGEIISIKTESTGQDQYGNFDSGKAVIIKILKPDEYVKLDQIANVFITSFKTDSTLAIPLSAIKYDRTNRKLLVQIDNGTETLELREIKVGKIGGNYIEILEGLEEGDEIYLRTQVTDIFIEQPMF